MTHKRVTEQNTASSYKLRTFKVGFLPLSLRILKWFTCMRLVFLDPSYTDFCVSGAEVFQLQPTIGHPSFFHLVIDQQVGNSKTNRWPGRRSRQFLHLISDHGSGMVVSRRNCFFVNGDLTNSSARPSRAWNRASTETTGNTGKWKRRRHFRPQTFACRQLQSACEPWNFQYHWGTTQRIL